MNLEDIIAAIRHNRIRISDHADEEAQADRLSFDEIFVSVLLVSSSRFAPNWLGRMCRSSVHSGNRFRSCPYHHRTYQQLRPQTQRSNAPAMGGTIYVSCRRTSLDQGPCHPHSLAAMITSTILIVPWLSEPANRPRLSDRSRPGSVGRHRYDRAFVLQRSRPP